MDEDLLLVAQFLASSDQVLPEEARARRAVSTAYYALFHALAGRCASTLVTYRGSDWETYSLAYRALDHAAAKRLFEARNIEADYGADIATLAQAFVNLQQARITADYVPSTRFPYGKTAVTEFVEQARNACQIVAKIPVAQMRRLAAQLILRRR
jgi:uncharacterized protein (UPF0332 family)